MDVQMPLMDGPEAARHIRRLPQGAQVPILALSAASFEEVEKRCVAAGMNEFIPKPIEPDILYRAVLEYLTPAPRNPKSADR